MGKDGFLEGPEAAEPGGGGDVGQEFGIAGVGRGVGKVGVEDENPLGIFICFMHGFDGAFPVRVWLDRDAEGVEPEADCFTILRLNLTVDIVLWA